MLRDLVRDGRNPGLLVHPDWWEPEEPQEKLEPIIDSFALRRPSPEFGIGTRVLTMPFANLAEESIFPGFLMAYGFGSISLASVAQGAGYLLEDGSGRYLEEDGSGFYIEEDDAPLPPPAGLYQFLLEDGSGHYLLENGSGYYTEVFP